ncbi:MAG TPA: phospholipase D-like domain-containing protein [Candidatus Nanoarchaeia archaeon]|nr:phospholipase D-like domain-containing protein [Candidatus Nanoarchaeia archaeon]
MHHKVFIIDNEIVITGSYNPTAGGDAKNRENILIIHNTNIAAQFIIEFERVWQTNQ